MDQEVWMESGWKKVEGWRLWRGRKESPLRVFIFLFLLNVLASDDPSVCVSSFFPFQLYSFASLRTPCPVRFISL